MVLAMPTREPNMTTNAPNVKPEFVSLQEAAVLYSVSVDLLRQRIASGELPAVTAPFTLSTMAGAVPISVATATADGSSRTSAERGS